MIRANLIITTIITTTIMVLCLYCRDEEQKKYAEKHKVKTLAKEVLAVVICFSFMFAVINTVMTTRQVTVYKQVSNETTKTIAIVSMAISIAILLIFIKLRDSEQEKYAHEHKIKYVFKAILCILLMFIIIYSFTITIVNTDTIIVHKPLTW